MCGIAGIFSTERVEPALLMRMAGAIAHRGPDDQGIGRTRGQGSGSAIGGWRSSICRRPAISRCIPPTAASCSATTAKSTITPSFARELEAARAGARGRLARPFATPRSSLEAIAAWGLEAALAQAVGMFAFALWDRKERLLSLVRDRFGEKPLYYGWAGRDFVFGSELKALRCAPAVRRRDRPPRAQAVRGADLHSGAAVDLPRGSSSCHPAAILSLSTPTRRHGRSSAPPEEGRATASALASLLVVSRRGAARAWPIRSRDEAEALEARAGACQPRSRASRWPTCRSAHSCRAGSTARRSSRSTRNIRRSRCAPSRSASRRPGSTRPSTPRGRGAFRDRSTTSIM